MNVPQKILVIDDEIDVGEFVSAAAQTLSFQCAATTDAKTFLDSLAPDTTLILLDLMMPEMDGVELLRLLSERKCKAGIVLMSGVGKRTLESAGQLAEDPGPVHRGPSPKTLPAGGTGGGPAKTCGARSAANCQTLPRGCLSKEELRRAIERDEFVLHYQPQIDIKTGCVTGVEALVRWQHPERGLIFPDSFIGRMEELGLIDDLGWVVVKRGMSEVGQFANGDGKAPMLSLNESVYSLHNLKFPDVFVSIAEKHGVSPGNSPLKSQRPA